MVTEEQPSRRTSGGFHFLEVYLKSTNAAKPRRLRISAANIVYEE
jgi:hypothetical protein